MAELPYQDILATAHDDTKYRRLEGDFVSAVKFEGQEVLKIRPEALEVLTREAFRDISFLYRTKHLQKVAAILDDAEASDNDRSVALALLRNAAIASSFQLPMCQDTGTATVFGKKGQAVWTGANDAEWITKGIAATYNKENLRYSQTAALTMFDEVNTGTNLPAQIDLFATTGNSYEFLFVAKGGGSANKSFLYQETKALLNPKSLEKFLAEKLRSIGTAACPPYHLAIVIGGTSAEATMKTVKLASAGYLDKLPTTGNKLGQGFRDLAMEEKVMEIARKTGIGAQFGGKYFALDARVIRLPRHGASCPVGIGVSCSADRNVRAKINRYGLWLEELERDPAKFIPGQYRDGLGSEHGVPIDLNRPMEEILAELTRYKVSTPLLLTGTIIVARDIAHAKIKERLDSGESMPDYLKNHPVYYAGPAKMPEGMPSGSFGPTTAGRMDSYVDEFQAAGGSMIMIAKGNRSKAVTDACKKHGGFYLGSIGGPAALLAQENIRKVEMLEFPELGMEAIYKIEVENFPAFILIDDKGHEFFSELPIIA